VSVYGPPGAKRSLLAGSPSAASFSWVMMPVGRPRRVITARGGESAVKNSNTAANGVLSRAACRLIVRQHERQGGHDVMRGGLLEKLAGSGQFRPGRLLFRELPVACHIVSAGTLGLLQGILRSAEHLLRRPGSRAEAGGDAKRCLFEGDLQGGQLAAGLFRPGSSFFERCILEEQAEPTPAQ